MSHLRDVGSKAYVHKELPGTGWGGHLSSTERETNGYSEISASFRVILNGDGTKVVTSRSVTFLDTNGEQQEKVQARSGRQNNLRPPNSASPNVTPEGTRQSLASSRLQGHNQK